MIISENAKANTVSSRGQLEESRFVRIVRHENSAMRVLFVGNSITRHGPAPQIGWHGDWGMAASAEDKDYVHQVLAALNKRCGEVDYCIAQCAEWERHYWDDEAILNQYYTDACDFAADWVIVRIGSNMPHDKTSEIDCKPHFDRMIRFFASNPKARVIVTDNFWRYDAVDQAIREITAERGYTFCRIGDLELDERCMALGQFEHGGVARHPSDFGMARIAERILEKIEL